MPDIRTHPHGRGAYRPQRLCVCRSAAPHLRKKRGGEAFRHEETDICPCARAVCTSGICNGESRLSRSEHCFCSGPCRLLTDASDTDAAVPYAKTAASVLWVLLVFIIDKNARKNTARPQALCIYPKMAPSQPAWRIVGFAAGRESTAGAAELFANVFARPK